MVYIIFCVRLLQVARSTIPGNSRASTSGTSNKYGSHAFLLCCQNKWAADTTKPQMNHSLFFKKFTPNLRWLSTGLFTIIVSGITTIGLYSCASTKTIGLTCQERQIEIYVDEEYLGRDLVYYTVPKGREYIEVSCRDNGMEVYHRRINVKDRNGKLIELQIPKNYKYSNKPF